ncbi:VWA domain-containing protein [Alphaproteobacteria bacterium]|nr:VWA domain-containing protein [Alphaproteobacteria bacterium]
MNIKNSVTNQETKLLDNILRFIRLLRKSGVSVGNQSSIDTLRSIKILKIGNRKEFYWALFSNLINRNEDKEIFDQCFYLFWQNPKIMEQMFNLLLPQIGKQKAPENNKKPLKRINDLLKKPNIDEKKDQKDEIVFDAQMSWSNKSTIKSKDFEMMSLDEIKIAKQEIKKLLVSFKKEKTRRWNKFNQGLKISPKDTIKKGIKNNGLVNLVFKNKLEKPKPLVILIDVSGSMESYSRMMLFFSHLLVEQNKNIEVFIFGTKLTKITKFLNNKDIDHSLYKIGISVNDWAAGTKIASSIHEFNQNWARRILTHNQTLLLISDGLERDDENNLETEIKKLSMFTSNLIWLNPLLRYKDFEPKVKSIKTILKQVDKFIPIHNVNSIEELVSSIF